MSSFDKISIPGSPERKQQSRDAQKVLRLLAHRMKAAGFDRTKPSFFTRPQPWLIEFVHLHKYTFGPLFRVHLGIRIRCDDWSAVALNGPTADGAQVVDGKWHQRFEYALDAGSMLACADNLAHYLSTHAAPWFESVRDPQFLLTAPGSPLYKQEKVILAEVLRRGDQFAISDATRKVLNVA